MPARPAKGNVATASVDITVPLSNLARALGKARTTVASSMRAIGRVIVSSMTRAWTAAAASVRLFTRALGRLRTLIATSLGPVVTLLAPLAGLAGIAGAVKAWSSFEQAMANVGAVAGTTRAELERLSAKARELGRTTAFSAVDAASAMESFALAGFSVDEMLASVGPTLDLAAAGTLDMGTAADIVSKTMRGMGLDAGELTRVVDVMTNAFTTSNTDLQMLGEAFNKVGPVGKAAGKSIDELTAAIQVMSDAGIQGSDAGTALRNILLRMQGGTSEVEKAFSMLGMKVSDDAGRLKHLGTILDELNRKTAGLTDVEKSAVLTRIAGTRAAAALNVLLDKGGGALRQRERALAREGTAAEIAAKKLNTLSGQFKILWSVVMEAAISLGQTLAPAVAAVVGALQSALPVFGNLLEQIKPVAEWFGQRLASGIQRASQFVQANLAVFRKWAWEVTQILANAEAAFASLFKWFGKLFGVESSGFAQGLVGVLDKIIEAASVFTTRPAQVMAAVGEEIKAAFYTGVHGFEVLFGWFWRMGYQWGEWLYKTLANQLLAAIGKVPSVAMYKAALDAKEDFWHELRRGLKFDVETSASRSAAAAKQRARQTWEKAKEATIERRKLMSAGGVFGMAPKIGDEAPTEGNVALEDIADELWGGGGEKAKAGKGAAAKPRLAVEGAGKMSGIIEYLNQLQAGLSKKDKMDDVATNTKNTVTALSDKGDIVPLLTKIAGKKSVATFG